MTRQGISIERINFIFEDEDGGNNYKSGIIYKRGTMVIYNGKFYASVDDLDSGTGSPETSPDKWAEVMNE